MKRKAIAYPGFRTIKKRKTAHVSKTVAKYVKKTVNRMSETKSYAGADSASLYFDNVLSVSNIPAKIVLGTGDGQRIGQEVFIKGINVKIHALCSTLKNTELYFAFIKHDEIFNITRFGHLPDLIPVLW